jgi:hypothetical protein
VITHSFKTSTICTSFIQFSTGLLIGWKECKDRFIKKPHKSGIVVLVIATASFYESVFRRLFHLHHYKWPQQPHFTKEVTEFYVSINHGTKMTYPGLSLWNGSSKTCCFYWFLAPFLLEAVEAIPWDQN